MKNFTIALCALCLFTLQASAQQSTIVNKDNIVSLGIGFGGNLYSGYYGSGIKKMPAISLSYERCVKDNLWDDKSALGVGGLAGFASAKYEYGGWGWKSTNFIIGARGVLHYAFLDKLDTYTGLMLGYDIVSFKWTGTNGFNTGYSEGSSGFSWAWFVGARYYFVPQFSAFVELGYGIAVLNLGVSYKF